MNHLPHSLFSKKRFLLSMLKTEKRILKLYTENHLHIIVSEPELGTEAGQWDLHYYFVQPNRIRSDESQSRH